MTYLYHRVPKNMRGKILYPLNRMKKIFPDLYKVQAKKYAWRKHVLKEKVPYLDCLWNDVIHLTPMHPSKIQHALKRAGHTYPKDKFFVINPRDLDAGKAIIFKYPPPNDDISKDKFEKFSVSKLKKYTKLRKAVERYYRKVKPGERVLRYRFIPHVLYMGAIDISKVKTITA